MGELVADLEGVCELEPGVLLDISLSLLLNGTFLVSSTCKVWGSCNLHALKKAKASMITWLRFAKARYTMQQMSCIASNA